MMDRFVKCYSHKNFYYPNDYVQNENIENIHYFCSKVPVPYNTQMNYMLVSEASKNRARQNSFTFPDFIKVETHFHNRFLNKSADSITPELILDAPEMRDDFYLHLIDWHPSSLLLSVALNDTLYLWNYENHQINCLFSLKDYYETQQVAQYYHTLVDEIYISSVKFVNEIHLACGLSNGIVMIWDIQGKILIHIFHVREDEDYDWDRVTSLSNNFEYSILSCGLKSGKILHFDSRLDSFFRDLNWMHIQEVCGLQWNSKAPQYLASGGNDNLAHVWDIRKSAYLHCLSVHNAAVKALDWSPYYSHILASGGGSTDRSLCIWNVQKNEATLLDKSETCGQICSLKWSRLKKDELVTAHGFAKNELKLWWVPSPSFLESGQRLKECFSGPLKAHKNRVLDLALSCDGAVLVSSAADENLKFWTFLNVPESERDPLAEDKEAIKMTAFYDIRNRRHDS